MLKKLLIVLALVVVGIAKKGKNACNQDCTTEWNTCRLLVGMGDNAAF